MTLEDGFIKNTALAFGLKEELIDKIVRNQWKEVKEATLTGTVIEISGLGRLQVRPNYLSTKLKTFTNFFTAAKRELDGLNKDTDERWYPVYKKLQGIEKDLEFLNKKRIIKRGIKNGMEKDS